MDIRHLSEASRIAQVPNAHRLVVTHWYQMTASPREHKVVHPVVMTDQRHETAAAFSLPNFDCFISRSRCKILSLKLFLLLFFFFRFNGSTTTGSNQWGLITFIFFLFPSKFFSPKRALHQLYAFSRTHLLCDQWSTIVRVFFVFFIIPIWLPRWRKQLRGGATNTTVIRVKILQGKHIYVGTIVVRLVNDKVSLRGRPGYTVDLIFMFS